MAAEQSSPKMRRNTNSMKGKYEIKNENDRTTVVETLKQRLLALNNRLSRYQLRQKQYRQNYEFVNKPNKLYDEIRNNKIQITTPPTKEQMSGFWKPIFQNTKNYNKDAVWLNEYKQSTSEIIKSDYSPITTEEIKTATSNFSNWKSPGLDKIQNFWWKKLTNVHQRTSSIFDHLLQHPEECPEWLTTGRTTLVSKKKQTHDPANCRPITCLPTIYKVLTSIITSRMNYHVEVNNIIPKEQKGGTNNTTKWFSMIRPRESGTFPQSGLTTKRHLIQYHTTG